MAVLENESNDDRGERSYTTPLHEFMNGTLFLQDATGGTAGNGSNFFHHHHHHQDDALTVGTGRSFPSTFGMGEMEGSNTNSERSAPRGGGAGGAAKNSMHSKDSSTLPFTILEEDAGKTAVQKINESLTEVLKDFNSFVERDSAATHAMILQQQHATDAARRSRERKRSLEEKLKAWRTGISKTSTTSQQRRRNSVGSTNNADYMPPLMDYVVAVEEEPYVDPAESSSATLSRPSSKSISSHEERRNCNSSKTSISPIRRTKKNPLKSNKVPEGFMSYADSSIDSLGAFLDEAGAEIQRHCSLDSSIPTIQNDVSKSTRSFGIASPSLASKLADAPRMPVRTVSMDSASLSIFSKAERRGSTGSMQVTSHTQPPPPPPVDALSSPKASISPRIAITRRSSITSMISTETPSNNSSVKSPSLRYVEGAKTKSTNMTSPLSTDATSPVHRLIRKPRRASLGSYTTATTAASSYSKSPSSAAVHRNSSRTSVLTAMTGGDKTACCDQSRASTAPTVLTSDVSATSMGAAGSPQTAGTRWHNRKLLPPGTSPKPSTPGTSARSLADSSKGSHHSGQKSPRTPKGGRRRKYRLAADAIHYRDSQKSLGGASESNHSEEGAASNNSHPKVTSRRRERRQSISCDEVISPSSSNEVRSHRSGGDGGSGRKHRTDHKEEPYSYTTPTQRTKKELAPVTASLKRETREHRKSSRQLGVPKSPGRKDQHNRHHHEQHDHQNVSTPTSSKHRNRLKLSSLWSPRSAKSGANKLRHSGHTPRGGNRRDHEKDRHSKKPSNLDGSSNHRRARRRGSTGSTSYTPSSYYNHEEGVVTVHPRYPVPKVDLEPPATPHRRSRRRSSLGSAMPRYSPRHETDRPVTPSQMDGTYEREKWGENRRKLPHVPVLGEELSGHTNHTKSQRSDTRRSEKSLDEFLAVSKA